MSETTTAARPVSHEELWRLFRFLSSHETMPRSTVGVNFRRADALFCFGRVDPLVAEKAAMLYGLGKALKVMFTGGIGKDSGPFLTKYKFAEALFQATLAAHYGVPIDDLITEVNAKHGGDNCRLGYEAVENEIGRPPTSLIMVVHATSLRRLVEVFLTISEQEGQPSIDIQSCPTDYQFDPTDPIDRAEVLGEMDRLVNWPHEVGSNGKPKLRKQPNVPAGLLEIYSRLKAEQAAA